MAMGLPYRGAAEPAPVSDGIMEADKPEGYYTPPLINVIKFACNACDEKKVHVTDGCQGCLAHPCMEVCPKKAISLDRVTGKSIIDQDAIPNSPSSFSNVSNTASNFGRMIAACFFM